MTEDFWDEFDIYCGENHVDKETRKHLKLIVGKEIAALIHQVEGLTKERDGLKEVYEEKLSRICKSYNAEIEKLKNGKGHEYQISQMLDKSLSFLEKKVEKADNLVRNPHKLLFTKAKEKR
jgi:hypothetical protein